MNPVASPSRFLPVNYVSLLILVLGLARAGDAAAQTTTVYGWGFNNQGQANTRSLPNVVAVSAGGANSLALRADGTVASWGFALSPGLPVRLNQIMAIACGRGHALAVRSNGTLVTWGDNTVGQARVPPGLSNVVAVSGGTVHSLAVRSDGTVVAWGDNTFGQTNVPAGLSNVIAVSAGGNGFSGFSVALKSDGTVVAWGDNRQKQTDLPAGLSNVVAIAASPFLHTVGLKSDGTVVAWGLGLLATNVPRGLSNVVAISAGSGFSLALRSDGAVVAWGEDLEGETRVPSTVRNVAAIASGWFHNLAVVRSTPPLWPRIGEQPRSRQTLAGQPVTLSIAATSGAPLSYRWQFRGRDIPGETNSILHLENPQPTQAGDYAAIVTADGLSVRSAPAFLTVLAPPVALSRVVEAVEDTEQIIVLEGTNPSGLSLVTTIASLPGTGALYQFEAGQRGRPIESVPTVVIDPQSRVVFIPAPDGNGAPYATFDFTVANEIGVSAPGRITIMVAPVNDAPVARVHVNSPTLWSSHDLTHLVVVALDNARAAVAFEAGESTDADGDPLEFFWSEAGAAVPFAMGVQASNFLEVGQHAIVLRISDGTDLATATVVIEVISPGEVVEEMISSVMNAPGLGLRRRPLVAILKAAIAAFDRGHHVAGIHQLLAFQNKVQAQLTSIDPALAASLISNGQALIEMFR
jgi:hypothetical protein